MLGVTVQHSTLRLAIAPVNTGYEDRADEDYGAISNHQVHSGPEVQQLAVCHGDLGTMAEYRDARGSEVGG